MTSKHLKKIESSGVLFELNGNYDRLIPEKAIKEYSPRSANDDSKLIISVDNSLQGSSTEEFSYKCIEQLNSS